MNIEQKKFVGDVMEVLVPGFSAKELEAAMSITFESPPCQAFAGRKPVIEGEYVEVVPERKRLTNGEQP